MRVADLGGGKVEEGLDDDLSLESLSGPSLVWGLLSRVFYQDVIAVIDVKLVKANDNLSDRTPVVVHFRGHLVISPDVLVVLDGLASGLHEDSYSVSVPMV